MKKFIISLFFVIFTLFNVCGENVKGEIILPKIERKFVDISAQNPLKATNVEGIFIGNPYKGSEKYINNKGYRIFVLDKNSNELLYIIEDVVFDWRPNYNNGLGGRVIKDDFCLITKDCVEYLIKGNMFNCEVHSYLEGKYLTEDGEDLIRPVIRDDIDEDIKKIEQALVDYVLYPEMVERGFDVHRLDNMEIGFELWDYIESFFRPNVEKDWNALDTHHMLCIKDENGKWITNPNYHKWVKFSNEYGTKDELLKKGYVENETMFYYPSNGEKDWRVGEWTWFDWNGWSQSSPYEHTHICKMAFADGKYVYGDGKTTCWFGMLETKKSVVIDFHEVRDHINNVSLPKKENLIIDMSTCMGGSCNAAEKFATKIKNSKYKKIFIIMNDTASAGEYMIELLDDDKRVVKIGLNTSGACRLAGDKTTNTNLSIKKDNKEIILFLFTIDTSSPSKEGIGIIPDIWANNLLDVFLNLWSLTGDYELKIDLGAFGDVEYSNYSKYSSKF